MEGWQGAGKSRSMCANNQPLLRCGAPRCVRTARVWPRGVGGAGRCGPAHPSKCSPLQDRAGVSGGWAARMQAAGQGREAHRSVRRAADRIAAVLSAEDHTSHVEACRQAA
jgi:hypothetical protein